MNERLENEKNYLKDYLADISHQIRTPMTSIKMIISRLSSQEITFEERFRLIKEISKLLTRIEWLITALLKVAQLKSDTVKLKKEKISVEKVISKALEPLRIQAEIKNVEIKQKIENGTQKEEKQEAINDLSKEIEALSKVVEEFALNNKDNQKYIDDLNFDITNLKISVNSFDESGNSIDEIVERIKQDIENNKQSISNKEESINKANEEKANLEESITNLEEQIKQIKSDVENSANIVETLKANRLEANEKLKKAEEEISSQFNTIEDIKGQLVKLDVRKTKLEQDLEQVVNNLWVEYELTPNNAEEYKKPENVQKAARDVNSLRTQIKELGSINVDSIEEYKKTKERYDFMCEQRLDLENTTVKLRNIISEMTQTMKEQFIEKLNEINKNFNEVFVELFGGGKAELKLEDENNVLECGIDIQAQPTGKKLQNMMLLSGGEKAFTAIALLFAILKINPAPFCVLDEIEAALDDVNVYRFAEYLKKFSKETQFLVITHRKGTMEAANTVYGVTMEENGVSKLLSMKLS